MLLSMTGFGDLYLNFSKDNNVCISIKTLNSKFLDVVIEGISDSENNYIKLRHKLKKLIRGRILLTITNNNNNNNDFKIAKNTLKNFIKELKTIVKGANEIEYLHMATILFKNTSKTIVDIEDKDWYEIDLGIDKVIKKVIEFRIKEGKSIKNDILKTIKKTENYLSKIDKYDKERKAIIKDKLNKRLIDINKSLDTSNNKVEQELALSSVDKIDINEEKVRFKNHLKFFLTTLKNKDLIKGTKLSFIISEMIRELNTMSSKSSYFKIQKATIEVKELLNRIKEQLANVL